MNNEQFRELINLFDSRRPDLEYKDSTKEVVAVLKSYNSQSYTKLAQKVERISALEAEVKQLKEEVKAETRENIADLFDAEDAVRTRVVETVSFILTLSKDPAPTVTPKYKDILEALSSQLTPELITVLEELKQQMVTVTNKSPSLKVKSINEGKVGQLFAHLKNLIFNWGQRYDQKLDRLKQQAGL
jgi:hypothetical protein